MRVIAAHSKFKTERTTSRAYSHSWIRMALPLRMVVLLLLTSFYGNGGTMSIRAARTYHFGKTVTYVTRSGKTLDEDTARTRVKVGIPVQVHYVGTGDNIMVDRVILDED